MLPQLLPQVSPVQTKMVPQLVIFWCERVKPVGPSKRKEGKRKKREGGEEGEENTLSPPPSSGESMPYPYCPWEAQYPLSVHVKDAVPSWTQTAACHPICPSGARHLSSLPGRGVVPHLSQEGRCLLSVSSRKTTYPIPRRGMTPPSH